MPTPLKLLTIKQIKRSSSPISSFVFQSYNGLNINNHPPNLEDESGEIYITFTGDLKIGDDQIIPNWLDNYSGDGPYTDPNYSFEEFYYLKVKGYEVDWVQICQRNVISSDCLDEVNFWIPVEVGDQVLILLDQQWNSYVIQQIDEREIIISSEDNSSIHKLIYLNSPQIQTWKVFGAEDLPHLIWFHSGELDYSFIDNYLNESQ